MCPQTKAKQWQPGTSWHRCEIYDLANHTALLFVLGSWSSLLHILHIIVCRLDLRSLAPMIGLPSTSSKSKLISSYVGKGKIPLDFSA